MCSTLREPFELFLQKIQRMSYFLTSQVLGCTELIQDAKSIQTWLPAGDNVVPIMEN